MTFADIVSGLLKDNRISSAKMLADLELGKNQFTYWKKHGNVPNGDALKKIADYFGVSVNYLLGREEQTKNEPAATQSDSELDDLDKLLMDFVHRLTADQKKLLLAQLKLMLETQG